MRGQRHVLACRRRAEPPAVVNLDREQPAARDQLRVSDVQASTQHAMRQADDSEHVVLSVVSSEMVFR